MRSRSANAALRSEMLGVAKIDEGIETGDGFKDDIAAFSAIAAIWAAIFDVFFTPKRHSAHAAVARLIRRFLLDPENAWLGI